MAELGRMTMGVISDTHGILRPEAVEALHDSELQSFEPLARAFPTS
jgi:predicted phosphodiesterase